MFVASPGESATTAGVAHVPVLSNRTLAVSGEVGARWNGGDGQTGGLGLAEGGARHYHPGGRVEMGPSLALDLGADRRESAAVGHGYGVNLNLDVRRRDRASRRSSDSASRSDASNAV